MSDNSFFSSQAPSGPAAGAPQENVLIGLLGALAAVVGGIVLAVVLWRIGIIAGLSSFVIAGGATALYIKASGTAPRRGLPPLVALIIVGVVISFFAVVASDLWDAYAKLPLDGVESRTQFIKDHLFNGEVLRSYKKDGVFFAVFAVLGMYGAMRRLIASAR